jgi:hypothetical protein
MPGDRYRFATTAGAKKAFLAEGLSRFCRNLGCDYFRGFAAAFLTATFLAGFFATFFTATTFLA